MSKSHPGDGDLTATLADTTRWQRLRDVLLWGVQNHPALTHVEQAELTDFVLSNWRVAPREEDFNKLTSEMSVARRRIDHVRAYLGTFVQSDQASADTELARRREQLRQHQQILSSLGEEDL